MTPKPCRVALVGAGYTAAEHARAFRGVPGVTLSGIFSRTRARAEALAQKEGIGAVCGSIEELYDRSRADLVVVTVPELSMSPVAKACFAFPWTALLEKPAGYDLEDAVALEAAARAKGRKAFVALNRAFYASTQAVIQALAGEPGPRFIKVQDQQSQKRALAAGQPAKVVENWMFANSIHLVDYFRLFARGNAAKVTPVLPWTPKAPAVVAARVDFESGDVGLYEAIWNGPGPWAATVTVEDRRWELRPLEQLTWQHLGQPPASPAPASWDQSFKPGFRAQAEQAVAAALGRPSAAIPLEDGLRTMRLIAALYGQAPGRLATP